jgi:hypothetical protein
MQAILAHPCEQQFMGMVKSRNDKRSRQAM